MDPLSAIFQALRFSASVYCRLDVAGAWGIEALDASNPAAWPGDTVYFHALQSGRCHFQAEGDPPSTLVAGDVVVLPHGDGHVLGSSSEVEPVTIADAWQRYGDEASRCLRIPGDGPACEMICGGLTFERTLTHPVLSELPTAVIVRAGTAGGDTLRSVVELAANELADARPGSSAVLSRLGDLLFLGALRCHYDALRPAGGMWFEGIVSGPVAQAVHAMHEQPGKDWSLDELADLVHRSRSSFTREFRAQSGMSPYQYLVRWRMILATHALRQPNAVVETIADTLGYRSVSAFTRAFERVVGITPRAYQLRSRALLRRHRDDGP